MFSQLLAKSPHKRAAERLYAAAASQARTEALYSTLGAPDTVDGRFELLTLHVILLVDRLKSDPGPVALVRQALFDCYVSNLDGALREMGVGDLAVGKRMRKLGEAFYGRARACDVAFQALPDTAALEDLVARTVLLNSDAPRPAGLTAYIVRCREALATIPADDIIAGAVQWSPP